MTSILMVAAENGLLPGYKVGGIGDVIADLSRTLVRRGHAVTVITPDYGAGGEWLAEQPVAFEFGGEAQRAGVREVASVGGVRNLLVSHAALVADSPGQIYVHDGPGEPFATDAIRFALFSTAVAAWVRDCRAVQVLHLHDWHAAPVAILRALDPAFKPLQRLRTVFTIHNLALQGVRPIKGGESSFRSWFGKLGVDDRIKDPRWRGCVNLMRAGLRLTDHVNTVSPSYAAEIRLPNASGRHGGEGLEADLQKLAAAGRLSGVLNGCDYGRPSGRKPGRAALFRELRETVRRLAARERAMSSAHFIALDNLDRVKGRQVLVTSIGRIVHQKMGLLMAGQAGVTVLDRLLEAAGDEALFVFLGAGDAGAEQFLVERAARRENLVYLSGFSETAAELLYRAGDLFLMPSLFEPCGLSQMLAMKHGQPCIVHAVGGLKDTVSHGRTGWTFDGADLAAKSANLVAVFEQALAAAQHRTPAYRRMVARARAARFTWEDAAAAYEQIYRGKA